MLRGCAGVGSPRTIQGMVMLLVFLQSVVGADHLGAG
jgi:hypothetical protein